MKFIIDAQLPPVMALWLRAAGHEAEHLDVLGMLQTDDLAICRHARETGAIIVTKDEDFAEQAKTAGGPPVIVWLRIGNCSNAELRAWLEPRLSGIVRLVEQGGRVIEVI